LLRSGIPLVIPPLLGKPPPQQEESLETGMRMRPNVAIAEVRMLVRGRKECVFMDGWCFGVEGAGKWKGTRVIPKGYRYGASL
jgi:hypothetical protein